MIFFSVPTVGQIKPETLFGEDDHYGFIQTISGEEYKRDIIKGKCQAYYDKDNQKYWDQIITVLNFLGLKKLDEENRFCSIPILDYVAERYDVGDTRPSVMLFDYLLCQWQYPHPLLTSSRSIGQHGMTVGNPRTDLPTVKPYVLLLSVLLELYRISPDSAFLSDEEFYWLGYSYYARKGEGFTINDISGLVEDLLTIRSNGWRLFNTIRNSRTHLSYPNGFLRNSSILTTDGAAFPSEKPFFIGLNRIESIESVITSLFETSADSFVFSRSDSTQSRELAYRYSEYLYDQDRIGTWLSDNDFFSEGGKLFEGVELKVQDGSANDDRETKIAMLLRRISDLDKDVTSKRRTEQHLLREFLFGGKNTGRCAICQKEFQSRC